MAFGRLSTLANTLRRNGSFISRTSYIYIGFLTWIPAIIFFNTHIGETTKITGPSMYPYFNTDFDQSMSKDICWKSKYKPADGLQRGMIVTFWSPMHPDVQVVKRIIALEGDRVHTRSPYAYPIADVPAGHVWVEGDGGNGGRSSLDSNTYGPVSKSMITGRITHVIWPWRSFGPVHWWEFKSKRPVVKAERHDMFPGN